MTQLIGIRLFSPKPIQYLIITLFKSSSSWEQIQERVEALATKKKGRYGFSYKAWLGNRVGTLPMAGDHRNGSCAINSDDSRNI